MPLRLPVAVVAALVLLAGCGGAASGGQTTGPALTVVVSAPVSSAPWIANFERNGAELAAAQLDKRGGVTVAARKLRVVVQVLDNAGSPQTAAANARQAVAEHAAAMIIDGVGAAAVADVTAPASLPVFVVFDGGASLIDPARRPTLFRLAPADAPMAMRLADYLAARHPKIGIIADDSGFGADGRRALVAALARDEIAVTSDTTVPSAVTDVSTQVLAARRAGVTTLAVWASAPIVAATIQAARSAGWQVPIWAGPAGEDPLVRQRLAAHPDWLSGVGFVSFRITAEVGPKPFGTYRAAYDKAFGEDRIGLRQGGKPVVQPPDWSMFPYDAVRLVAGALAKAGATGAPLLHTLDDSFVITGANGDERGYSATNHEGVSPDDMYFAVFHGFVFSPVTDDLLSQGLPTVPQVS